ncbi:hypothetical protein PSAB_21380 [Paenibacillus sabinae T27]|uniref:Uncharacterized protein n=1 Tax=Paenibacillus sabinae T27 TaxID=1268072 RepID=X4ZRS6_9BACL|nr:hypothetical protein PSAB_21380 [Paenibacillus sabinae T27]
MTTSTAERKAVEQAMKQTSDKRMHERYLAVLLRLEGRTIAQIPKTLHLELVSGGISYGYFWIK